MNKLAFAEYLDLLREPGGGTPLKFSGDQLVATDTGATFEVVEAIPQLLPKNFDSKLADHYELQATSAEVSHSTVGYHFSFHYLRVHKAFQSHLLALPDGAIIADIGCGHGEVTRPVARRALVFGIDLAQSMLTKAAAAGLIPLRASATALPLADKVFDCTLAAEMMQHLTDLEIFFKELVRVTKPGGKILVSTINRRSLARRFNRLIHGMGLDEQVRLRSVDQVMQSVKSLPVRLIKVVWVLSPFPIEPSSKTTKFPLDPLAQNFILVLQRAD